MGETRRREKYLFDVVLLGDHDVGKTCLVDKWVGRSGVSYFSTSEGEMFSFNQPHLN